MFRQRQGFILADHQTPSPSSQPTGISSYEAKDCIAVNKPRMSSSWGVAVKTGEWAATLAAASTCASPLETKPPLLTWEGHLHTAVELSKRTAVKSASTSSARWKGLSSDYISRLHQNPDNFRKTRKKHCFTATFGRSRRTMWYLTPSNRQMWSFLPKQNHVQMHVVPKESNLHTQPHHETQTQPSLQQQNNRSHTTILFIYRLCERTYGIRQTSNKSSLKSLFQSKKASIALGTCHVVTTPYHKWGSSE